MSNWRISYRDNMQPSKLKRTYVNTEKQLFIRLKTLERRGNRVIRVDRKVGNNWELV